MACPGDGDDDDDVAAAKTRILYIKGREIAPETVQEATPWRTRRPSSGAGDVRLTRPYAFTLDETDGWYSFYEWLRDWALVSLEGASPDREGIAGHFGPGSPSHQRDIAALKAPYQENAALETIRAKRRLWYDLLRTALGEIAYNPEGMSAEAQAALEKGCIGGDRHDAPSSCPSASPNR